MANIGIIIRLSVCAISVCWIRSISALRCDFRDPHGLPSGQALILCNMDIGLSSSGTVICPRRVNDTEYVWHPQADPDEHTPVNTYISYNGVIRSVALSDVILSESEDRFIWFESNASKTKMHLEFSMDRIYAITEHRFIFICGPRELFLSEILQSHLDRLRSGVQMQSFSWNSSTRLAREIVKIGSGLGILFLYRGRYHLPLQGCGSRPSPLFASDNEVTVDPITGIRSCVADPMSKTRIGFVCEGVIEPVDCMKSLLNTNGDVVSVPAPYPYWNIHNHAPWVIAKYFNDVALPRFNGECRCIDPETGHVKARMEIRWKTEYVCDIASLIFRNRVRRIHDNWCSVVLHPGSTLTIKFPIEHVDATNIDQDLPSVIGRGNPPSYLFATKFRPKTLTVFRQLTRIYGNTYGEVMYRNTIAGDALELDVSRMSQGVVKLKYQENTPLALIGGLNSFFYHWTLKAIKGYEFDKIRAVVDVSFAFTHQYYIVGCDRGASSVFYPEMNTQYCSNVTMGNGIGEVYECSVYISMDDWQAGIRCQPDEDLMPDNCKSAVYDLYYNQITPFPESVRSATHQTIPGFQVFDFEFIESIPLSYACICVDENGYEKSKLVLESYGEKTRFYRVRHEEMSHAPIPYILLPGSEIGVLDEWPALPISIVLQYIYPTYATLYVGTTLSMTCALDPEVRNRTGNGLIRTSWLPNRPQEFHYVVIHRSHGRELIRKSHNDVIIGATHGFRVVNNTYLVVYKHLIIESRRGAILISKDPAHRHYVPMTFVCGKVPDESDGVIMTGNTLTSDGPETSATHIIGLTGRYTWDVVQVAVETTDPYMQGCGVTYASDELFKPETPKLYDADGQPQFGCKIDIKAAKEAAFYCPAPYVLDPPNCFDQVLVEGEAKSLSDISQSLVASHSNHFIILKFDSDNIGPGEELRQTPPLECRCTTVKRIVLSTIQIENYYSK
ncbi:hypothetical protein BBBOND_0100690 [Babesia bigemina]|uniref:6-Cys domain-containing protein n=1 Tax=Babesia bigemina TaxID=5866 RepID=A0A061D7P6_BABBI|nr:hypothetical protein BBBOND_0100690 [Babesia bigemina]CDR93740.1 hypothetical protein BBBOND_0100690 [Babesia bigemina]|eukprot:XP_012765926.1 hypothetical protein BBBOND_0100690 [Babesia bigemina]